MHRLFNAYSVVILATEWLKQWKSYNNLLKRVTFLRNNCPQDLYLAWKLFSKVGNIPYNWLNVKDCKP